MKPKYDNKHLPININDNQIAILQKVQPFQYRSFPLNSSLIGTLNKFLSPFVVLSAGDTSMTLLITSACRIL